MSRSPDQQPRDVLAAEEFGMGTGDPALHVEPPHDVLAAEAFELGVGDPSLRRGPVRLPEEPYASAEAHDVLAAEEFAVPAGREGATDATAAAGVDPGRESASRRVESGAPALAVAFAFAALVTFLWRRRH